MFELKSKTTSKSSFFIPLVQNEREKEICIHLTFFICRFIKFKINSVTIIQKSAHSFWTHGILAIYHERRFRSLTFRLFVYRRVAPSNVYDIEKYIVNAAFYNLVT